MNQKSIAIIIALASILLVAATSTTTNPLVIFAQSESEGESKTETEEVIVQENYCSGFAVCTNAAGSTDPSEDAQTLIATPH